VVLSSAGEAAKALAGQKCNVKWGLLVNQQSNALRQIEQQKIQVEDNIIRTLY
jgi:hypothetical protein